MSFAKNPYVFAVFLGIALVAAAFLSYFLEEDWYPKEKIEEKLPAETPEITQTEEDLPKSEPPEKQSSEEEPKAAADTDETKPNPSGTEEFERELREYARSMTENLKDGKKRTDITIRYYPHRPDGSKVYGLSRLGFYLHERPTDPQGIDIASNSLYYGDNVALIDIQLVAFELIRSGFPLKQIKPSRFHDDWKSQSLEIGAERGIEALPDWSIADVWAFRKDTL